MLCGLRGNHGGTQFRMWLKLSNLNTHDGAFYGLGFRAKRLHREPTFFKVLEAPVPLGSFESTANNSVSCFLPIILSSQFLFRNFALFF